MSNDGGCSNVVGLLTPVIMKEHRRPTDYNGDESSSSSSFLYKSSDSSCNPDQKTCEISSELENQTAQCSKDVQEVSRSFKILPFKYPSVWLYKYNEYAGTYQMPSRNAKKRSTLAGGRPTNTGVDLRVPSAAKDTERGAKSWSWYDGELRSTVTSEWSIGTALSGSRDGKFRHQAHPRRGNYVERKRQRK